jgi:leucyl aminopeptidase
MKLDTFFGPLKDHKAETLLLFAFQDGEKTVCDTKGAGAPGIQSLLDRAQSEKRFKGAVKEVVLFRSSKVEGFENILVVGLGTRKTLSDESLRVASAIAAKTLGREKLFSVGVAIHTVRKITKTPEGAGQALAEGFTLGSYKYDELKTKKKDAEKPPELEVTFILSDKSVSKKFVAGVEAGKIFGEASCFARDLGNAPSNLLTPAILADRAREAAKGLPIKFQAFDLKQIKAHGMGGLIGVNQGSHDEPRFIIMEYFGGRKTDGPFVMVGKGLTFDSGGISIKPSAGMEEMKFDMCGSAAVIGAILAIARLKLKINVVTLVASTDNMPSGSAIKPGDVLTAMNGKTIEVNNTDAEGRLVLADALSYACKHYKPKAIVDAATLTGACVVALGNIYSGVFTRNEKLMKQIENAADISAERIWRLPMSSEHEEDMKGTYADLQNVSYVKGAGSSQGAAFLNAFVDPEIPWAHFDIAGTAWNNGSRFAYNPDKGASGACVRLFTRLAQILS